MEHIFAHRVHSFHFDFGAFLGKIEEQARPTRTSLLGPYAIF